MEQDASSLEGEDEDPSGRKRKLKRRRKKKRVEDIPHSAFHAFLTEEPQGGRNKNQVINNNNIRESGVGFTNLFVDS